MFPYRNAALPVDDRVKDLLARMTLDEKLAQMRLVSKLASTMSVEEFGEQFPDGLGATFTNLSIDTEKLNAFERYCIHNTRLGIPMLSVSESIHGLLTEDVTVFPQCIGLGATFDPELLSDIADVIGREAGAKGINTCFAPNIDLSRDPRWGRTEENYGEDPYLTSRMGAAYVRSLQKHGVAACVKHFIAHGSPESGINLGPVHLGEREMRETMLEPFAAAIREGGALAVMPAYSELDGVPLHASHYLLTDLLRKELGFKGCTISDFDAVKMLTTFHRVAEDAETAAAVTLNAGVDMEAPKTYAYGDALKNCVLSGRVSMELIDQAVSRILYVKFKLGLFEKTFDMPDLTALLHTPADVLLARRAAQESIVLLKNDNRMLPLRKAPGKIAVIGPSACFSQVGDYSSRKASAKAVTVYDALKERVGEENLIYAEGCSYASGTDDGIYEAIKAAAASDIAVLVLGDNSNFSGGIGWGDDTKKGRSPEVTCGEGFDQHTLRLPGRQQELLEKVFAAGKPVILLLMTGRPYAISWAKKHIPAILQAWYPGEQGGNAICDILFGDANPSGCLPISFPQSDGHIPCFYNYKVSARGFYKKPGKPDAPGRDYVFSSPDPLYPFGFGLSYTTFTYSDLTVSPDAVDQNGIVKVSVCVKNTGDYEGAVVVKLFISDLYCRITPFVRRLRRFHRVRLQPGESAKVVFELNRDDFAFINENMQPEVEPGAFRVTIGELSTEFSVQ